MTIELVAHPPDIEGLTPVANDKPETWGAEMVTYVGDDGRTRAVWRKWPEVIDDTAEPGIDEFGFELDRLIRDPEQLAPMPTLVACGPVHLIRPAFTPRKIGQLLAAIARGEVTVRALDR